MWDQDRCDIKGRIIDQDEIAIHADDNNGMFAGFIPVWQFACLNRDNRRDILVQQQIKLFKRAGGNRNLYATLFKLPKIGKRGTERLCP